MNSDNKNICNILKKQCRESSDWVNRLVVVAMSGGWINDGVVDVGRTDLGGMITHDGWEFGQYFPLYHLLSVQSES